jgi:hypothetical protein
MKVDLRIIRNRCVSKESVILQNYNQGKILMIAIYKINQVLVKEV